MSATPARPPAPRLNYYQQSPVRGQLEVPEDATKTGWRYIQCTDTPNELRVLLPPRTAAIYGHLLKVEAVELARDRAANWERIVEIRHLKDRMIRKCTRLGRAAASKDKPPPRVVFQTVHAPPDFRLKEMERWFKVHNTEATRVATQGAGVPFCKECVSHQAQSSAQTRMYAPANPSVRRAPSSSRPAPPERMGKRAAVPPTQTVTYLHATVQPPRQDPRTMRIPPASRTHARQASLPASPGFYPAVPRVAEGRKSAEYLRADHAARPNVHSPDPLPIPYRPRGAAHSPPSTASSASSEKDPVPLPSHSPRESSTPPKISTPPNGLPTIHERPEDQHLDQRPIVRQRSSLKKRDSMSRLSIASQTKSVAWAMDRDWTEQMSKYVKTTNEAEVLSEELERLRITYHCELETMRDLCMKVDESHERIRLETENLRNNQQAVRVQENKILASTEQIEQKQQEFLAKVLSALEESRRVVALCDKKRDIHESS
ncbi:hypothetical protein BD413DRAFT_466587 [Trametes elegans]|nr:hypothetical protein BD413DRAFT_466587 [Trametes elegans]